VALWLLILALEGRKMEILKIINEYEEAKKNKNKAAELKRQTQLNGMN